MNYVSRSYLPLGPVFWLGFVLYCLNFSLVGFAEDPIVVHYSDPSLTRMEAQIGVNAAQRREVLQLCSRAEDSGR
jgi:hypothetical protein